LNRPIVQKHQHFRSRKLLDAAKGQSCQNCGADDGTIVAAHSNWAIHGKGKGIKADDFYIAFLCGNCHIWLDQGKGDDPTTLYGFFDKFDMWTNAHFKTMKILFDNGILKVA